MKKNCTIPFLFLLMFIGIAACVQPASSEKTVAFKNHEWPSSYKLWIDIDVSDTNSAYNIYAVIRHTDNFKYNNLILNYYFIAPGDSATVQKLILPLGENNHWLGDTLESIIETRVKINKQPMKLHYGKNSFILQHLMPENTLKHIANVGIRIERSAPALDR